MMMMMMRLVVLVLCVSGLIEGFPVSSGVSQPSSGYTYMVPVTVMGSFGPQLVLVPVNGANWNMQRNQNPTAQTQPLTPPLTQPEQQMNNQNLVEEQNVNSPFLQLPQTLPSDAPTPEDLLPQGQVLPVWNSIPAVVPLQPSVNGQLFPAWSTPVGGAGGVGGVGGGVGVGGVGVGGVGVGGGVGGGQMQVVSVARVGGLSNSESSEEEDAQVIYLLPISAETGNMGLREGNGGAAEPEPNANTNPNANIHQRPEPNPNPDPNPAHMQQIPTAAPATGIQDTPAPQGGAPPSAGAGHLQQASTGGQDGAAGGAITPCKHAGGIANAKANVPPL